jgi:hypothetical protein
MADTATVARMTPPSDGAMRLTMVFTAGDGGEVLPQRRAAVARGPHSLPVVCANG